jgi:DNA helicase-2/ATP-dependent DNA helicase PcrA
VGDDLQAIYGFRSASARHILEFPDVFAGCEVVTLERSYRSTTAILDVANAVSAQDRSGYPRKLLSERAGGARPELCFPRDEGEQAELVCDRVLEAREEGIELRAQAVLFRAAHDSDLLELALARRGIPYVKYGGLRYLEAAHVKDLIAALRLDTNPGDEISCFRLLQLLDGVGPAGAKRILDALRDGERDAIELGRWPQACLHVPGSSRAGAEALFALLAEPADASRPAVRIEQHCSVLAPLIRLRYPDWTARLADYERLIAAAREAEDVSQFVSELVLDPPASSADLAGPPHLDEDYLVLSTVHSAKGLEWDAVHLIAAYDGNFPADMSAGTAEGLAEERRLLYVALTRPRRRLHVYVPMRYYHRPAGRDDRHGYGKASRFLTAAVQERFDVTASPLAERPDLPAAAGRARIAVSVDSLFEG